MKTFSELEYFELLEVFNRYVDENNYHHYLLDSDGKEVNLPQTVEGLKELFESRFYDISVLEDCYNDWVGVFSFN